jgi:hypothetical protein
MIAGEPGVYTLKISTDSPETIENTVILQFTVVATSTNG